MRFGKCAYVLGTIVPRMFSYTLFYLSSQDHRSWKEPSRLFESMVVVGLPPNCDVQALQRQYVDRKFEGSGKLRSALGYQNQSRVEPNIEPQVVIFGSRY